MLTELDNCILGVIWRDGPMSPYDVRSHFAGSTTVAWSSSTGTVYPAIKRLLAAGLVEAGARSGPRKRRLMTLTQSGLKALHHWLERIGPELGSSTADPLRTRVHFLSALRLDERERALEDYKAVTRSHIETLERDAAVPAETLADRSERLGVLGALRELEARLRWLESIGPELANLDR